MAALTTTQLVRRRVRQLLLLLCSLLVAWCLLLSYSSVLVSAQGSASATTGVCNPGMFVPTLPPWALLPPVYPNGSIKYERTYRKVPPENFFIQHWYVPVILILCAVCGFYILLAMWILYYFQFYAQHQAQKVVEKSYVENGYFDLRGEREMTNTYGREERQSRGTRSGGGSDGASSRGSSSAPAFVPSAAYADGDSSYTSESYDDSDSTSTSSEDREAVVRVNPLRR